MRTPARMYPVTLGSRTSLVSRVIKNPANSITARERTTWAEVLGRASMCSKGKPPSKNCSKVYVKFL